ncbi:MAG: hypothetical protein ABL904_04955 [Hyphomicrobiaceae bacterium]
MSSAVVPGTVRTEFARDADTGDYVLTIAGIGSEAPVASIRLPADVVETAVFSKADVSLEVRSNGTVTAFLDCDDSSDLASKSLADLVTDALSVLSPEDDLDDLAKLEHMLVTALAAVQSERHRLGAKSAN